MRLRDFFQRGNFSHASVGEKHVNSPFSTGVAPPESLNSAARILGTVSREDGAEQVAEKFLKFRETGGVVHFDALAFAADQAGFAQDFEMLGEGRLGQAAVVDLAEVGAIQGALGGGYFRVDLGAHGIGQGIEETLDGNVAESGMKER